MFNKFKKKESKLHQKERKLAFILLLPTIFIVLSIVIFPLLANFWISFKPISLGDLRPPKLIIKEKLRGKLTNKDKTAEIHYRYRNSSAKYDLHNVIFNDTIPKGFTIKKIEPSNKCEIKDKNLTCNLDKVPAKYSGKIILKITTNDYWKKNY